MKPEILIAILFFWLSWNLGALTVIAARADARAKARLPPALALAFLAGVAFANFAKFAIEAAR